MKTLASICCVLGLLWVMPLALAADEKTTDAEPSMDFLEFLGEWEDAQGNWQDPFEDEPPPDKADVPVPVTQVEQNDETH